MRALVVEDEWAARRYLADLLHASGIVEVVAAVATAGEAREVIASGLGVDVAFVDIHLSSEGEEAGLALIRSMAGARDAPLFVLATALSQHALAAYDLGVADYLLKPISEERVSACLSRLAERQRNAAAPPGVQRVAARSRKGLVLLDLDEVLAFEASKRLIFVHSTQGRFDVDLSLSTLEASLGAGFLRVHRQWLVHVRHVRAIESDGGEVFVVVADAGATEHAVRAPVSRERRAAVREMLVDGATGLRRT